MVGLAFLGINPAKYPGRLWGWVTNGKSQKAKPKKSTSVAEHLGEPGFIGLFQILINTPVFNSKNKDAIEYLIHPHSIYLDFKTIPLPADHFADASHLNPKGAQVLSEKVNQILYKVE